MTGTVDLKTSVVAVELSELAVADSVRNVVVVVDLVHLAYEAGRVVVRHSKGDPAVAVAYFVAHYRYCYLCSAYRSFLAAQQIAELAACPCSPLN